MAATELFHRIGAVLLCSGISVECIGLTLASRLQLHRAFGIKIVGILLWGAGVAMLIAVRIFVSARE
jgi:hypothetical protein